MDYYKSDEYKNITNKSIKDCEEMLEKKTYGKFATTPEAKEKSRKATVEFIDMMHKDLKKSPRRKALRDAVNILKE